MITLKEINKSLAKADIITGILTMEDCSKQLNSYFNESEIITDLEKLDTVFDLFFTCLKDTTTITNVTDECVEYMKETISKVLLPENKNWAIFCSEFIRCSVNVIENREILLEDKYEALNALDYTDLPKGSTLKTVYLNTLLNILISLMPNKAKELAKINMELKECIEGGK